MQLKSKKIVSTAIVSVFVLSILLIAVPLVLAQPTLTLTPNEGPSGTIVTIDGNGFSAGSHRVWFDRDGDSRWDLGEPYRTVTAASGFTTTLTVPSVASGLYYIRADTFPYTSPEDSKPFAVVNEWDIHEHCLAITDHALFDTTYPDEIGAQCKSDKTFDFHIVARAYGGTATIRITFADDSYIDFPLDEDGILSFTQAAGGTAGVDNELKVTVTVGDAVGWISIRTENGATPDPDPPYSGSFCITTLSP